MAKLTPEQVRTLSDQFYFLGMAIGEYRYTHWDDLSLEENKELSDSQYAILKSGEDMLAFAAQLVMDEAQTSIQQIQGLTKEIQDTIKDLKNIQKAMDVAAGILVLGAAILEKNPEKIGSNLRGLLELWKSD
ncbi:MAG: hypothetical protein EP311_05345 [Cytophagales bacterium]|uniref:Uncharacterized protein n=1 Tax=Algoriphagus taiwanensis TaxID=1445656 RepID=A0ABQ6Q2F0_9BACT|nr:MAG: hypothetical protein EP311_05345 [Cytophagales bacterium]GMQ34349.1 hypothetical protein Ataiwa_26210 [Algoriphagus taiwanensis]